MQTPHFSRTGRRQHESKNRPDQQPIRYTGHVLPGKHPLDILTIASHPQSGRSPFSGMAYISDNLPTWLKPGLSCLIQRSEKTPADYC